MLLTARLLVGRGESRADLREIARERTELLIRHVLEPYHPGPCSLDGANELVELELTSCHVSEKP
jgi:hypothetical protein